MRTVVAGRSTTRRTNSALVEGEAPAALFAQTTGGITDWDIQGAAVTQIFMGSKARIDRGTMRLNGARYHLTWLGVYEDNCPRLAPFHLDLGGPA
ncbi:MAG: hypothetical protein AAFU80_11630 [Pseudomonadota bacterium]